MLLLREKFDLQLEEDFPDQVPTNLNTRPLSALGDASLLLCAFVFPDGRFVPSWTRWLALLMLVYWAAVASFPSWGLDRSMLSLVLFFSFVLGTIVLQFYRYRYVSKPH